MRRWKTCLMRKQHMDTLMKVGPDTATDSDYQHIPILESQTKKWNENNGWVQELPVWNNAGHGRVGPPAPTANAWLSKGKEDKGKRKSPFSRTQCFLVLRPSQSFLNTHCRSGWPSFSTKWGSTTHTMWLIFSPALLLRGSGKHSWSPFSECNEKRLK